MDLFDLSGRVALVTGGNRGIGRAVALGLAAAGADVAIAARDEARTAAVVAEVEELGRRALGIGCDVGRREDLGRAVEATVGGLAPPTILVNNAGISIGRNLPERYGVADWQRMLDVNLTATLLLSQLVHPHMAAAGGGKIINNASEYALFGNVFNVAYGATKTAVVSLTKSLASGWGKDNIQVNAVIPGAIRTEIWGAALENEALIRKVESMTPAARWGEPEDLAGIAIFLASRASDFVTGQSFAVDGGFSTADLLQDFAQLAASAQRQRAG